MTERRVTTVLFDAGGVLLDLDYAFLKRLLEARHVPTTVEELSESESIARTTIDRRVREGGRSSEAWRDYFRILLTRVGTHPRKEPKRSSTRSPRLTSASVFGRLRSMAPSRPRAR